jgi:hypothetical protein
LLSAAKALNFIKNHPISGENVSTFLIENTFILMKKGNKCGKLVVVPLHKQIIPKGAFLLQDYQ